MKHPLHRYTVECGAFTTRLALPVHRVEQAENGNKEAQSAVAKRVAQHLGELGVADGSRAITYPKLTIHAE